MGHSPFPHSSRTNLLWPCPQTLRTLAATWVWLCQTKPPSHTYTHTLKQLLSLLKLKHRSLNPYSSVYTRTVPKIRKRKKKLNLPPLAGTICGTGTSPNRTLSHNGSSLRNAENLHSVNRSCNTTTARKDGDQ